MTRTRRLQLYLIGAGTVIGLVSSMIPTDPLWANWLLVNEPFHSAVETVGALAAIVMAIFLILKRREDYGGKVFLLAMGLLGMGLIDIFHSISPAGHGFVLFRSVASLIGAFWFVLIWLPWCASERDAVWKRWTPWAVVVGAILLGIWASVAREALPIMVKDGTFTSTAVIFNLLSGVFFLAAAIRLLIDFGRIGRPDIYLFACMATLFGLANLTFLGSELWDATWWFWHLLRLISYVLALGFVIHEHQQTISDLRVALDERKKAEEEVRKHRDHLGELVQERTAELRKANEGLQQEMISRKQVEQALRESEERLEAILDNSTAVVYAKDTEGRYILVNRQFETLFHITSDQIKGKSDYDLFPKETAEKLLANDRKVLEVKAAMELEEIVPEDNGQHVYISIKFPLYNSNGTPYAVCSMSTDITERKHAEEHEITERKKAEDWLHTLIATTQDAVVSIDHFGRIVRFNPAAERIFGYTEAEAQGQKINLLMGEPYASEHDEYIVRFERTHEPRAIGHIRTVVGRRKNGEVFPIEVSITQITNDEEIRYAAFIRDISEKKRLHDQLIENERLAAVGATAAALTHEIGNPLNGMSMTAQLLERRLGEALDTTIVSGVRTLKNEISRLNNLLHDFGSFSRRERYNFQSTSVAAVAEEVCAMEIQNYENRGGPGRTLIPRGFSFSEGRPQQAQAGPLEYVQKRGRSNAEWRNAHTAGA